MLTYRLMSAQATPKGRRMERPDGDTAGGVWATELRLGTLRFIVSFFELKKGLREVNFLLINRKCH